MYFLDYIKSLCGNGFKLNLINITFLDNPANYIMFLLFSVSLSLVDAKQN